MKSNTERTMKRNTQMETDPNVIGIEMRYKMKKMTERVKLYRRVVF